MKSLMGSQAKETIWLEFYMVSDHSKDTSLDPMLPFLGLETQRAARGGQKYRHLLQNASLFSMDKPAMSNIIRYNLVFLVC